MKLTYLAAIFGLMSLSMIGQTPFNCRPSAYLFQNNDLHSVDLSSGQSSLLKANVTKANINASAYNPTDGYLWGTLAQPDHTLVRIGRDLEATEFVVDGAITAATVGDIDREGKYYAKAEGAEYAVVDLNPTSDGYLKIINYRSLSIDVDIDDWAYNNVDNQLYSITSGDNLLVKVNPDNGDISVLGEVPVLSGLNYTYGALYFDRDGHLYAAANQTGTIYQVLNVGQITTNLPIESNVFSFGPASRVNDGARCASAPVLQEICFNGRDDDGDGLVDCDDPACSGVGNCPVLASSGGNQGGLESNNRLSQQIAKRNLGRALYPVPETKGNALPTYSANNGPMSRDPQLNLTDMIPIGVINESAALESSPDDLIDITNATEVFSVDYKLNDTNIATVLALKTEGQVYEHSKYICDRLLGAELHSVSKFFLNGHPFIKSNIYRADGTREFVVSFAVKVDENSSIIESHWNQDSYTSDGTYFNFQIWASSVDDLYTLANEILQLVNLHRPITEYQLSDEPLVFVQSAIYNHGILDLKLMNNNFSTKLIIEGGKRTTETGEEESVYIEEELVAHENNLTIEIGSMFDLGIRISTESISTPDDLFVSDGPWGIDDAAQTEILDYTVVPSAIEKTEDNYPVERGVELTATTADFFSIYRAMTPRFEGVDLSHLNNLSFLITGEGILEITLVKESVSVWDDQLHAELPISGVNSRYHISAEDFATRSGQTGTWDDISLLVFTQRSMSGEEEQFSITLSDVVFKRGTFSSINPGESNLLAIHPNPVDAYVRVTAQNGGILESVAITDLLGQTVYLNESILDGQTQVEVPTGDIGPGVYSIVTKVSGIEKAKKIIIQRP